MWSSSGPAAGDGSLERARPKVVCMPGSCGYRGSARADFPGGDAGELYDSIQKILELPDEMRLFMCHDYGPDGREIAWETTVAEQKARNIHVGEGKDKDTFVEMRDTRDATLAMPKLIIPSLQVNMRAGQMPEPDEQGDVFLKVPVNKI